MPQDNSTFMREIIKLMTKIGCYNFNFENVANYLYGVHMVVFTDHKVLEYIFTQKELKLIKRR